MRDSFMEDKTDKVKVDAKIEGRTGEIEILKDYLEQSMISDRARFLKKEWKRYFSPYANRLFPAN